MKILSIVCCQQFSYDSPEALHDPVWPQTAGIITIQSRKQPAEPSDPWKHLLEATKNKPEHLQINQRIKHGS
jgi:hypothetical protein